MRYHHNILSIYKQLILGGNLSVYSAPLKIEEDCRMWWCVVLEGVLLGYDVMVIGLCNISKQMRYWEHFNYRQLMQGC